jgi:GAF domain-containing protein/predicted Ser/Thr protein kinase
MDGKLPEDGKTLAHFTLIEQIGQGGMGVVHKAWDTRLERVVALKVLPPDTIGRGTSQARLLREAQIASALNHPNIATIYGLEQDDGQQIIAMEYVQGPTLAERLRAGPMEVREALDISVQIADALGEAHANGVVHRDIKPPNIILTPRGHPKVMDFGLAKLLSPKKSAVATSAATRLTAEGIPMGTAAYMSPEQALGKEVDARADIFAFGLVLYEMLTRQPAFSGDSDVDLLYEIIHHQPRPAYDVNPDIPSDLQAIVDRCLAKDPEARYPSGKELCEELKLARINLDIQRTRTLHTLFTVSREMTSILDIEPLLERVATVMKGLIDYDMLGIFRVDEAANRLEWLGGAGYIPDRARMTEYKANVGVCGRAIRTRQPILLGDVGRDPDYYAPNGKAYASNLVVPLLHMDRVIGVLNMESHRPHFFTNEHLTVMSTLGGQIAVAIENARLFEETRRHSLAMAMLIEIGREIASILDLDSLLDQVGALTRRVIDYELFTIFLLDQKTGRFTWRTAIGYDPAYVRERELQLGEGVISRAVEQREAILVDDVSKDPGYLAPRTLDGRIPRSELAVPLVVQDRVLGVLTLESVEPGHFNKEHAQLMTVLASQVAVAIENARLYREIRDRARAREEEAERIRRRFESYVTPHIAEQVFNDPTGKILAGERRPVTVLVADIRGFTALSERLPPPDAARFLREFFSLMTHVVFKYEGTVDKFLGDALMALYGAPVPHDPRFGPSDPQRAVFAALDMRDAFARLRDKWWAQHPEFGGLELTLGISTGIGLLGNLGSDKRVEYTTIGPSVNQAFRLCRDAAPGEIRIDGRTQEDVDEEVRVEPVRAISSPDDPLSHLVMGLKLFS